MCGVTKTWIQWSHGAGALRRGSRCLTGTFINATKDTVLQAHGDVPWSHLSELVKRTGGPTRARRAEPANGDRGQEQDSSLSKLYFFYQHS